MIGIERLEIATHFCEPRATFFPTTSYRLSFVHQFPAKDIWIIAVKNTCHRISTRYQPGNVISIHSSSVWIGVKQNCLFIVDTEVISVVRRIFDPRPAKVLGYASGIAPPIDQTKLNAKFVPGSFSDNVVEMHEGLFIPLIRSETKWMVPRPISKVRYWLDVVWSTFAKGPHANNANAGCSSLAHRFRHTCAVIISVHDGEMRANETKRSAVEQETTASLLNEVCTSRFLSA